MFNETTKSEVTAAVERIISDMAASAFPFEGDMLSSTISAGLAEFPEDGPDVKTVTAKADQSLYVSKRTGKNRLTVYRVDMAAIPAASREERAHTV
jgi:GGDEF domain-containing protein